MMIERPRRAIELYFISDMVDMAFFWHQNCSNTGEEQAERTWHLASSSRQISKDIRKRVAIKKRKKVNRDSFYVLLMKIS